MIPIRLHEHNEDTLEGRMRRAGSSIEGRMVAALERGGGVTRPTCDVRYVRLLFMPHVTSPFLYSRGGGQMAWINGSTPSSIGKRWPTSLAAASATQKDSVSKAFTHTHIDNNSCLPASRLLIISSCAALQYRN